MKTVMQELLYELQIRLNIINSESDGLVRDTMIDNFLIDTNKYLEQEKQQIIDAYNTDSISIAENGVRKGELYYDYTFGDNHEAGI